MGFENSPNLTTLVVLILLFTLTGLAILAISVYFYCCQKPKRIPTIRRQSYSLSMKANDDAETSPNIKFLDPAVAMNRSTSFEVRNSRAISSSPNFEEMAVHASLRGVAGPEHRPAGDVTRFLPNWRRLVHVESSVRLPLTASGDRDVSLPGLEESSLESMLRKFDSLVLSFRWTEPLAPAPAPRGPDWDDSLDVFSCRSNSVSTASFLSLHWGRLSETDIYKSISSEDAEHSHTNI